MKGLFVKKDQTPAQRFGVLMFLAGATGGLGAGFIGNVAEAVMVQTELSSLSPMAWPDIAALSVIALVFFGGTYWLNSKATKARKEIKGERE